MRWEKFRLIWFYSVIVFFHSRKSPALTELNTNMTKLCCISEHVYNKHLCIWFDGCHGNEVFPYRPVKPSNLCHTGDSQVKLGLEHLNSDWGLVFRILMKLNTVQSEKLNVKVIFEKTNWWCNFLSVTKEEELWSADQRPMTSQETTDFIFILFSS